MPFKFKGFKIPKKITFLGVLSGSVQLLISVGLYFLGVWMIIIALLGKIDFGTYGEISHFNAVVYMFLAITILSTAQVFMASTFTHRFFGFVAIFAGATIALMVLGSYFGIFSAYSAGDGIIVFRNIFMPFEVDLVATGDLTVALSTKVITDSIVYLVNSMIIVVILIQLVFSNDAGEFTKALIKAVCVVVIMALYASGGGIPLF